METISGTCASAIVYTAGGSGAGINDYARAQIQMICDNEAAKGARIRVMPDVHPGKVGTIGLTMTVGSLVMPSLIGIDIGCGMAIARVRKGRREWQRLDGCIAENIPSGFAIRRTAHAKSGAFDFSSLLCERHVNREKAALSLGTLGGGNHFIEVDEDGSGNLYVVIHSGSRRLGKEVTEYYLGEGQKALKGRGIDVPYPLTWLDGDLRDAYLHDLQAVQDFAALNREIMLSEILRGMKWKADDGYACMHNYIASDPKTIETFGSPVLRKGAISAMEGEKVVIPANMRDGAILGTGLGNREWNCSAPHGTGRVMKREDAKNSYTLSAFKKSMKGIYSPSISEDTLDEAPFAYRPIGDILSAITDTVKVDKVITPVYNFKAGSRK